ncbi:hypothetical protein NC651_026892 [Populus alba x Populus x berolinensis]|nr:hypothetical protein NC651_026869 [Populus alba x Populus x berolinensis]KAJ6886340.1 hypothetical protein NC651_026892 [Populus alba x Populus x berolinensis]
MDSTTPYTTLFSSKINCVGKFVFHCDLLIFFIYNLIYLLSAYYII